MSPSVSARRADSCSGFLREQLQARTTAEAELRVMLAHLEQTNASLAASLCVKALPPAPEPEAPRRIRWWWQRVWGVR